MRRCLIILLIAVTMTGCASKIKPGTIPNQIPNQPRVTSPATKSELAYGKTLFQDGYYKRAMEQFLPLAAEGNAEAQYAVGYMYYYGFGSAQDTTTGHFWISRSANQHFQPAINALVIIERDQQKRPSHTPDKKLT